MSEPVEQQPAGPRRRPSPVPLDQRPGANAAPTASGPPKTPTAPTKVSAAQPSAAKPAKRRRSFLGWLPVAFGATAILLAATAGVVYIFAPGWFGDSTSKRNVGVVPTVSGKPVSYLTSPRMIRIPAIAARAPIVPVGTVDRELQIPLDPKVAGWWSAGAKPGAARGTAIIAGHINYAGVTGEFATIGKLNPGDKVYVSGFRAKKQVKLRFRVTGVRTYVKKALPYQQIFNQKSVGRLAIVTCGGPFDSSTGNYEDNIVVFAVPD